MNSDISINRDMIFMFGFVSANELTEKLFVNRYQPIFLDSFSVSTVSHLPF